MTDAQKKISEFIDAEFRKAMGVSTCNVKPEKETVFTMDMLRKAAKDLRPPPPQLRLSKHVPALGELRPKASPHTDDMRHMCEDIGPQKVPVGWQVKFQFGDLVVINPVNLKGKSE